MVFLLALFLLKTSTSLNAQPSTITVPDYSYGAVQSQYGTVTSSGVANPGPYGGYLTAENERASGVFLAPGFRWWGYPSYPLLICGKLPEFSFPGSHGVMDMSSLGCMNPPIGYMGSWGGVITDPANRTIWCLNGAKHEGGPTNKYCIPNPFGSGQLCYNPPSNWGYGDSYGYLRKVVVIQSSGSLQPGDPVQLKATITAEREYEGEGTISSKGVLFLNKPSQAIWWKWGMGRDYLKWGDVEDLLGTTSVRNNMLALIEVNENNIYDSTVSAAVGDTLILELMFHNSIKHVNTGSGDAVGWIGEKPDILLVNPEYARTDSVKKLIKKHGNNLVYDLICLTTGAVLEPVTQDGPNLDEDKDGISDNREKGADGNDDNFDGNSDGTPDYKQSNAASFLTYDAKNYVTLAIPVGYELSQLKVTDNPSPLNTPSDPQFPFGFFDFSIDGLDPGEAVTLTMILHDATSVEKYYKYGVTPDNLESHWYDFTFDGQTGAQINGNVIILHFVDGLRGDEDITVNGSIKEPGGPAITGATGFKEFTEDRGILVYPNPATNIITLRLNNIVPPDDYVINIHSITGALVHQKVISVIDDNQEIVLPVDHLPEGIYMITLSGNAFNFNKNFIKLK